MIFFARNETGITVQTLRSQVCPRDLEMQCLHRATARLVSNAFKYAPAHAASAVRLGNEKFIDKRVETGEFDRVTKTQGDITGDLTVHLNKPDPTQGRVCQQRLERTTPGLGRTRDLLKGMICADKGFERCEIRGPREHQRYRVRLDGSGDCHGAN